MYQKSNENILSRIDKLHRGLKYQTIFPLKIRIDLL